MDHERAIGSSVRSPAPPNLQADLFRVGAGLRLPGRTSICRWIAAVDDIDAGIYFPISDTVVSRQAEAHCLGSFPCR